MCKEGWSVRLGACVRVGETASNTLEEGGMEKRGGETKILDRGWQARLRGGCLKKRGAWNLLGNYENVYKMFV